MRIENRRNDEKRKAKARRLLQSSRERLEFYREAYAEAKKDKNDIIDIPLTHLDGQTIREVKIKEALEAIKEEKESIGRFERLAK